MAQLTEQEKAYNTAWQQRQAASLSALPEYALDRKKTDADEEGAPGEDDQSVEEPESVVDEDQTRRDMYQQQLGQQKVFSAQQSAAAAQTEEAENEGGAEADSKDNLILFFASLFLASIKDLLDYVGIETLGILGTIINLIITGAFGLILLLRGSKLNTSKSLVRYIAAAVIEFIPIINFLPAWTIAVLWEKLEKKLPAGMQVVSKTASGGSKQGQTAPTNIQPVPRPTQEDESDDDMRMAA